MPEDIVSLIKRYNDSEDAYQDNETETRSGLLDPLLQLLGWDVTDPRQVRREQSVATPDGKKRTDYILYDDRGRPVVVIEAKAPKVNIEHDNDAIFQVLRYGWNLETVPVGILTNFTNWEVYQTSTRPDKQNTQRFRVPELCFDLTDYASRWESFSSYFSREAVLRGDLRTKVTTAKPSLPPDEAFLKDLERYRELIAKALAGNESLHHNWDLSEYTQRVLDRLLLIRILEDRGYGERGGWLHRIAQATDPGQQLSDHVARLQPTFNSRFFKWHEVDSLKIEPDKLHRVVKELANPDSIYDFAAMPVEIIGKAYEKFLGSTVRITPKRRVKIESKPEVRKAGGVYYTPSYIVDYIVQNTLGPLFADKSESAVAGYKVLDPACGSGSFLIGAARWLDGWYQQKYGRKLTYQERRTIVLRHLHGVDIDQNAVEVTQLSLCLWLLEEAPHQMEMAHEALLPDLSANVKCGNSLIGSDFYTQDQRDLFADAEVRHRVNAFDWDGSNGFAEIMERGGFDAVIGNPPWGATLTKVERIYLENYFGLHNTDTACLFMAKSVELLKSNGLHGFIIPKSFVYASNWKYTRERFIGNLKEIVDCGKVWRIVKLEQVIYFMSKKGNREEYLSKIRQNESFIELGNVDRNTFDAFEFILNGVTQKELSVGNKIRETGNFLNDYIENQRGEYLQKKILGETSDFKVIGGSQINRYGAKEKPKGYIRVNDISNTKAYIAKGTIIAQNIIAHIMNPIPHVKIIATILPEKERVGSVILDTVNALALLYLTNVLIFVKLLFRERELYHGKPRLIDFC